MDQPDMPDAADVALPAVTELRIQPYSTVTFRNDLDPDDPGVELPVLEPTATPGQDRMGLEWDSQGRFRLSFPDGADG